MVKQAVENVVLDAGDLPGYAGALFDFYDRHAEVLRLSIWARLERPDVAVSLAVQSSTEAKVRAIREAQSAGKVSSRLQPAELLAVIVQISLAGTAASPELSADFDREQRRRSIVLAVAAIAAP